MKQHQLQQLSTKNSQSGFTIIESLVALLVVAILLTAIAPVIVLSTATRVQAKRVELATQAAKTFVEGVQAKTISDPPIMLTLTATNRSTTNNNADYLLSSVPAPGNKNDLYCFNKNGSITGPTCTSDLFYIQAFQSTVQNSNPDQGQGYRLAVRVYRADATFGSLTITAGNNSNNKTAASFTGGLGNRNAPLVEMTTEIVRGQPSYSAFCARLGGCQSSSPSSP